MDDKELANLLFSAIRHHNQSLLEDLLSSENAPYVLDVPGEDGNTLLHFAVLEEDLDCVVCLLKHGADPNRFDSTRARSPLHLAVERRQIETVKTFLSLPHVNLEIRDDRNLTCFELAQFCGSQDLSDIILEHRRDHERFKDEFYSVVNQASSRNDPTIIRGLLEEYGEKIISNLPSGWYALRDKTQYSRSLLKDLINWSSSSWNDVTLLFKSASKGHTEVCKVLIEFGATAKCNDNTNYSPLYVAAYGGHTSTVKLLLDSFPSLVQEVTIEKWTVLHACCLQGHSETASLILNYAYPDVLKRRFTSRSNVYEYEFAFDLNAQDAAGQTVIYLAVLANNETLLDSLLAFNIEAKLLSTAQHEQELSIAKNSRIQGQKDNGPYVSPVQLSRNSKELRHSGVVLDKARHKQCDKERKFYTSSQIDNIMSRLRKSRISKELQATESSVGVTESGGSKYLTCPFEMDTYCDYNSKTALHLAVCQQFHDIATTLLVNGANPNLPILFRDSTSSSSNTSVLDGSASRVASETGADIGLNWLRSSKSTCLKEACRLNDDRMCAILIRYGARDNPDNLALQMACAGNKHELISMFLSLKSNVDPEFKINRKCNVEFSSRYKQGQRLSKLDEGSETTTFSSMFPSTPVAIYWQNLDCIQQLDPQWLMDASLAHNKRLRHPTNSLMAITRLDLSSNKLKSIHPVIFRLPSLRELDLSSNRIESLPHIGDERTILDNREPMTSTNKLIKSQRTAMKRSKSSNFTGSASLENSNIIDLNEAQEWDLPYLEVLDLHDNLLMSLPDCLFQLPKLTELDLSSNQLRQLPWAMWTAPNLRELNVAANHLEDLPKVPPHLGPSSSNSSGLGTISDISSEQEVKNLLIDESLGRQDASSFMDSRNSESWTDPAYIRLLRDRNQVSSKISVSNRVDIEHLNHWSRSIEMTHLENDTYLDLGGDDEPTITTFNKLSYLNLSRNLFKSIPPVLACISSELTRLNMSHNRLDSLGDISLYPQKLKNLDVSNNQLVLWFNSDQPDDDTKHCYTENIDRRPSSGKLQRGPGKLYCSHKLHQRLDNLRSLNLSYNHLRDIQLHNNPTHADRAKTSLGGRDSRSASNRNNLVLLYPNIIALDLSFNRIQRVPDSLYELKDLSVLNLNGNVTIASLPPELGLSTKLWNLGVNGCNLSEPLKSIVESKTYKTMDIIGYLRSILEEAKPYARMKLMLVGLQGIGKTSLLEQMRHEGSSGLRRHAPEHWTKRMGHTSRSNLRNQKGVTLSTVGVDIHDWVYQKKATRSQPNFGPVSFSTWDFGGQDEFYATHRYFLSRRSIYLVVWRLTDGLNGILGIQQWLVNIHSRAPGSPVIIVGTHEDLIEGGERSDLVQKLQSEVKKRFMDVVDHDKSGLPRIMDSIVVSARTKHNVKNLCNRIYDVAFSLRCPGSTERLLEQKIPATYLYLEEIVSWIVHERHQRKREPVLSYEEYKKVTSEQLKLKYNRTFRDLEPPSTREINHNSELHQATRFLHENGVLLHYDDSNLRNLYFLDPQWLCDILSHVVTIREINPHVRNGLMRIDDLAHLFKSMDANLSGGVKSYVINLLNKFEVALTWNSQYLLIPSLLPNNPEELSEQKDVQVKLAPRMRGRSVARRQEIGRVQAMRSTSIDPIKRFAHKQIDRRENMLRNCYEFEYKPEEAITRIVLLRYLPAGFLARLQSAILSDPAFDDACEDLQLELLNSVLDGEQEDIQFAKSLGGRPGWICWRRGIRLRLQKESTINTNVEEGPLKAPELLVIQELDSSAREILLNKIDFKIECDQVDINADHEDSEINSSKRTQWLDFDMNGYSNIIAVTLSKPKLKVSSKEDGTVRYLEMDHLTMTKLLCKASDYIDDLLEDWYPSLGARFAHTLGGNYLVTRVSPCRACASTRLMQHALGASVSTPGTGRPSRESRMSERASVKFSMSAVRDKPKFGSAAGEVSDNVIYCYYIEQCILNAYRLTTPFGRNLATINVTKKTSPSNSINLQCPRHGPIPVSSLAPDIVFDDLLDSYKICNNQIERCKLIGRGALGFVFKGNLQSASLINQLGQANREVALKLLQPVDPGPEADQADRVAYNSAKASWHREPFQSASKSYCTARHEINILQKMIHPSIVSFIGICLRPLAIVLELAPMGSLSEVFKNYKRASSRIDQFTVQKSILQVARALEFLHQHRVIYRDLKSENILVWSFPSPFATKLQSACVELKLADYGISRQALSTGVWKGFAGTMSYLAPEILRHNGDEEYTEKVDCFSFGMLMYELLFLRPPHKLYEPFGMSRNQFSTESGRPTLHSGDLVYPSHMLDLMSLCCSPEPHDRPTASQIVSIAGTPEFIQIQDVIQFSNSDMPSQPSFFEAIEHQSDLDLWFSDKILAHRVNILASSRDKWIHCEHFQVNDSTQSITCMCLVEGNIWLCDLDGRIHITPATSRSKSQEGNQPKDLDSIGTSQSVEVVTFVLRNRRGQETKMGPVKSMLFVELAKSVIFLTSTGLLWICKLSTMLCEPLEDSAIKYNCLAVPPEGVTKSSLPVSPSSINSSRGAESQDSSLDSLIPPCFQLYCGQSNGISCLEICEGEVRRQSILPLAGSGGQISHEESIDDTPTGAEITHIVVGADTKSDLLWTAANCTVHLWSMRDKHVKRKLDCCKLVPCSESLESINIEKYYDEAKTSEVSSLVHSRDQLFVGTSHGCFIVIEASTLKPTTVFRPFESQVTILRPLQANLKRCQAALGGEERRLVAIGRGYRDLMKRYLASGIDANFTDNLQEFQDGPNTNLVAILLTTACQYSL